MAVEEVEGLGDDGLVVPVTLDFSFADGWVQGWVGNLPSQPPTEQEHAAKIPLQVALRKQIKKDQLTAGQVLETQEPRNWEQLPDEYDKLRFKISRHTYRCRQLHNNKKLFEKPKPGKSFVNKITGVLPDWAQQMREKRTCAPLGD